MSQRERGQGALPHAQSALPRILGLSSLPGQQGHTRPAASSHGARNRPGVGGVPGAPALACGIARAAAPHKGQHYTPVQARLPPAWQNGGGNWSAQRLRVHSRDVT